MTGESLKNTNLIKRLSGTKPDGRFRIGISACLVGERVRYDGGHRRSVECLEGLLGEYFQYKPFCPEVAAGFGVPRPTLQLTGDISKPVLRLVRDPKTDMTQQLVKGFQDEMSVLEKLDGFIFKSRSPSCGLQNVPVFNPDTGVCALQGRGLFVQAVIRHSPQLPVAESDALIHEEARQAFLLNVVDYAVSRQKPA